MGFRVVLSFFSFSSILKNDENFSTSENSADFRKVQRQTYSKIAKVSLKSFNWNKYVIELYIEL